MLMATIDCSYGSGQWTDASRSTYNLVDALTRHTAQVIKQNMCLIPSE